MRISSPEHGTRSAGATTEPLLRTAAAQAVSRIRDHLLPRRHADGFWEEPLICDTTTDSDTVIYFEVLGRREPDWVAGLARHIVDEQLPDGGWHIYPGGPGEPNATLKAYVALKLAGHPQSAPHMLAARKRIRELGGVGECNAFTKIYLSMLGMIDWHHAPAVPPEMMLLPRSAPFHVYAMSYWARCIVVPLSILWAHKFRVERPRVLIDEIIADTPLPEPHDINGYGVVSWEHVFLRADQGIKLAARVPVPTGWNPLRAKAIAAAKDWLIEHFECSAGLGAIFPAMVNAAFALRCLGYGLDHPLLKRACDEVDALIHREGDRCRVLPCTSPVWNTAIAVLALGISGTPADDGDLRAAAEWICSKEVRKPGDWFHAGCRVPPGGWYFQFANEFYPDVDDTAMVLMALHQVDLPSARPVMARAIRWLLAMQNVDGGWGAFDVENNREWLNRIPFAIPGSMVDPSTADLTARVLEMLGRLGMHRNRPQVVRRAIAFLQRDQKSDGSWYGRWGVNYVYGTWQVLEGMAQIGFDMKEPWLKRGADRLQSWQNPDGGWGESIRSYEEPQGFVPERSTPSQTAWAIMGLIAAGRAGSEAVRRGVRHLADTQRGDGSWDETLFTGTGFPRVFYLAYPMYKKLFPLMALAKYLKAT